MADDAVGVADLPPHDLDAEAAIIAAVLYDGLDGRMEAAKAGMAHVTATDFYRESHRRIWAGIEGLTIAGTPADWRLLAGQVQPEDVDLLRGLAEVQPSPTLVTHYARVVAGKSAARSLIQTLHSTREAVYANGRDTADIATAAIEQIQRRVLLPLGSRESQAPIGPDQLGASTDPEAEWLWKGWLARGHLSMLAGDPKAGKSYFLAAMIAAISKGHPFLGHACEQANVLLLSEENTSTLRKKRDRFGWRDGVLIHPRAHSYPKKPWPVLIAEKAEECRKYGCGLLVVDTMTHWAGFEEGQENDAGAMNAAAQPLLQATATGIGVLLSHHTNKSEKEGVGKLRGSGAIPGAVDAFAIYSKVKSGDRRRFLSEGRWEAAEQDIVVELQDGGYRNCGAPGRAATDEVAQRVTDLLKRSPWARHGDVIDIIGGHKATVVQVLAEGVVAGAYQVAGDGTRARPKRYALPGADPL